jgi:hypothetical protein
MNWCAAFIGICITLSAGHACGQGPTSQPQDLRCDIGPVTRIYGEGQWLVYGCSDDRSVILVSAPGNPASPFVFSFIFQRNAYQLDGQGAGNKAATAATFDELKRLSRQDIANLLSLTKAENAASKHPRYAEAVDFAASWVDLFDAEDEKASFDQLAPIFQRNLTPVEWRRAIEEAAAKLGKRRSRTLRRVVWYENSTNAPLPGLYAAVEFDSVFENASKHFRFVILHSQNGEPFKVMRSEADVALDRQETGTPR